MNRAAPREPAQGAFRPMPNQTRDQQRGRLGRSRGMPRGLVRPEYGLPWGAVEAVRMRSARCQACRQSVCSTRQSQLQLMPIPGHFCSWHWPARPPIPAAPSVEHGRASWAGGKRWQAAPCTSSWSVLETRMPPPPSKVMVARGQARVHACSSSLVAKGEGAGWVCFAGQPCTVTKKHGRPGAMMRYCVPPSTLTVTPTHPPPQCPVQVCLPTHPRQAWASPSKGTPMVPRLGRM